MAKRRTTSQIQAVLQAVDRDRAKHLAVADTRPTKDIDLQGRMPNDITRIVEAIRDTCLHPALGQVRSSVALPTTSM